MKKFIALLLAMLLMTSLCLPAHAAIAQYASTRSFTDLMDAMDMHYSISGITDGNEVVQLSLADNVNGTKYTVNLFFEEDECHCSLHVWDIISYSEADFVNVVQACNTLNGSYKYLCFSADETDNTVNASLDMIITADAAGLIVGEAVLFVSKILQSCYPYLAEYAN